MQIVVVSNPAPLKGEPEMINALFEHGLSIFHLRKPDYSEGQYRLLLQQIKAEHHPKIALHQHHQLTNEFDICRLHYSERLRKECPDISKKSGEVCSTSVHNLPEYKKLTSLFDYVLLGPVFDSISKKGYKAMNKQNYPNNLFYKKIKIFGIGGITQSNGKKALQYGFDGLALMGYLWRQEQPVKSFKKLLKEWNTKGTL